MSDVTHMNESCHTHAASELRCVRESLERQVCVREREREREKERERERESVCVCMRARERERARARASNRPLMLAGLQTAK